MRDLKFERHFKVTKLLQGGGVMLTSHARNDEGEFIVRGERRIASYAARVWTDGPGYGAEVENAKSMLLERCLMDEAEIQKGAIPPTIPA